MRALNVNVLELTRALIQAKVDWQHPLYLVHAITARCNARCGFCAWNPDFYDGGHELDTAEVKKLYSDARAAGFLALSIWGGEPLVRPDIGELTAHAKRLGFASSMVTNGFLLDQKLSEVVDNVDRFCISVDHPSEEHDRMRHVKGLYGRILAATLRIRTRYPDKPIVWNYTLMRKNSDPETIEEMAKVMKELGVSGIFNGFRAEAATEGDHDLSPHEPSPAQLAEAFRKVRELKKAGYPILCSNTYIDKMLSPPLTYRCHWPKVMLPIEANGDVVDCMSWGTRPVGNVRETPFEELLRSPRIHALAGEAGEACHRCTSVHRIEISEAWEGRVGPVLSWIRGVG